ncbi:MAG: glycerophosphodiester phosphodiesterase family protein [Bacillota bacterium]
MKKRLTQLLYALKRNYKTLIGFEILYRTLGAIVIFPLATALFYTSIALSPYDYITNSVFFDYLYTPSTIILAIIMALILGVYLVIEMVFLSYLFYYSHRNQTIDLKTLLFLGGKEIPKILKKYHIFIILASLFFFLAVELAHVVGIASTVQLPPIILDYIDTFRFLLYGIVISFIVLYVLFFETLYTFNIFIIDRDTLKDTYSETRQLLKKNRLPMILEFILLNGILNGVVYAVYLLLIGIVGLLLFLIEGQDLALGLLLTGLYSIYIVISFVVTITLIPINFAWMSTWYYSKKVEVLKRIKQPELPNKISFAFLKKRWVKRLSILILAALLVFNGISLYASVNASRSPIQLFNYPSIIAHRGASVDAPENTLAAIELALEDEADAIEIDVRLTKDNVPVLIHDATLTRTTDDTENTPVSSLTYDELLAYDAGGWFDEAFIGEPIPTLEEALTLINGRASVYIELKVTNVELIEEIVSLTEELDIENDIKILSFDGATLRAFKERNDSIETVLLIFTFFGDIGTLGKSQYIDNIALEYNLAVNNESYVTRLQQTGKKVYVYTVNSENRLRQMNDLSVDGVITDVPIQAREIIYTSTTRSGYANLLKEIFSRN